MSFMSEFREFAVKGSVVDLAVGVIIGAAFGKIVDSLVKDLIMPVISRIFGGLDFSNWFVMLGAPPPGYSGPMTYEALTKAGVPLLAYGNFITVVLDDGSDTTKAVTNTRKLLSEDKVDVIVGSTVTPNSLAMVDIVADAETPMIAMAASGRIVDPANPKVKWVFKTPQSDSLMADAIAVSMKAN